VAPCFEWAHAANPEATLMLNDFGQIAYPILRKRFHDLVQELKARNTPLHGIGLQSHEPRLQWYSPEEVWSTFESYQDLELPIHITEFHPHSSGAAIEGGYREGIWSEETQAEYAEQMLTLAFGHPSVVSFSWWDFTENDSFIKGSALLNKDMSPKPAYDTLDRLINHEWKTRESLRSDDSGQVQLNGFYGNYEVRIIDEAGKLQEFELSHTPGAETHCTFTLMP